MNEENAFATTTRETAPPAFNRQGFCEPEWDSLFSRIVVENADLLKYCSYNQLIYSIHISTKNKIIYFDVPKNGSSSIKTFLHRVEYNDNSWEYPLHAEVHDRTFSPLLSPFQVPGFRDLVSSADYFCFCVFREPSERLVSGYLDKIVKNGQHHNEIWRLIGREETRIPSFKLFLYWLATQTISDMDIHWRPQFYLSFLHAIPNMQIFRFDQLASLASKINQHVSGDFSIPMVDHHKTDANARLTDFVDDPCKELILKMFKQDYEVWDSLVRNGTE